MIEDNQEHGQTAEEDGERVEIVIGYHVLRGGGGGGGAGGAGGGRVFFGWIVD